LIFNDRSSAHVLASSLLGLSFLAVPLAAGAATPDLAPMTSVSSDALTQTLDRSLIPDAALVPPNVSVWISDVRERIAPRTKVRSDGSLPDGVLRTVSPGSAGVGLRTIRFERLDGLRQTKMVLGYRILRQPEPRVVVRGTAPHAGLAGLALRGFSGALHFAGAALRVIATAYTSGCVGCTGYTASGARAGQGIIAVDPRVIPLGTKVYVPGYGRAIAGDTGGAIVGRRVDLGFDTLAAALNFGRRPVMVYVVK